MKQYIPFLKKIPLFSPLDEEGISHVLTCLEAHIATFDKKELLYAPFDPITYAGVVLEGEIVANMLNSDGNEFGVRHFFSGDIFGESYSCVPHCPTPLQIIACKKSTILFLKFSNLFQPYTANCPYASRITANLLLATAQSNILQNLKIKILTQKHIRERILSYLYNCGASRSNPTVYLPFNRQEFANYLGVERSALSRELSNMRQDGIITFRKNVISITDSFF